MQAIRKYEVGHRRRSHPAARVAPAAIDADNPVAILQAELAARLDAATVTRWRVVEPPLERFEPGSIRRHGVALTGGLVVGAALLALILA